MIQRSVWDGCRVLVTGHTGFKGAWLSLWLEYLGADVVGLSLPPEGPDGAFTAFLPWKRLESHMVDLRDREAVARVVSSASPDIVFHLGAQALVRQAWADPPETYAVNVLGTANLLDAVACAGCVRSLVVVTSDKVYSNDGTGDPFDESSPLGGTDPYGASKACAELVVRAWRAGNPSIPVATVRAGNVVGGGDTAKDRLFPDAWRAVRAGDDLVLRHPAATRPWQFVLDPLTGYLLVAQLLAIDPHRCPPSLNFGPSIDDCLPVSQVADAIVSAWGSGRWIDAETPQGPPEAAALRLNAQLAAIVLGWHPRLHLATAIRWTVEWWQVETSGGSLRSLALEQLRAYEDLLG